MSGPPDISASRRPISSTANRVAVAPHHADGHAGAREDGPPALRVLHALQVVARNLADQAEPATVREPVGDGADVHLGGAGGIAPHEAEPEREALRIEGSGEGGRPFVRHQILLELRDVRELDQMAAVAQDGPVDGKPCTRSRSGPSPSCATNSR